jgi:hypothetical protein
MKTAQRGSGSSEVLVIIAFAVYVLFMGYLGNAAGYTASIIGNIGDWQIPYIDVGGHWYSVFTGTLDVFIAVLNVFGWVLGSLASYIALIGWSITGGEMPEWITVFLFTPLGLGIGWMILSLIRGR